MYYLVYKCLVNKYLVYVCLVCISPQVPCLQACGVLHSLHVPCLQQGPVTSVGSRINKAGHYKKERK